MSSPLVEFLVTLRSYAIEQIDAGETEFVIPETGPMWDFIRDHSETDEETWADEFWNELHTRLFDDMGAGDIEHYLDEISHGMPMVGTISITVVHGPTFRSGLEQLDPVGIARYMEEFHRDDNYDLHISDEDRAAFLAIIRVPPAAPVAPAAEEIPAPQEYLWISHGPAPTGPTPESN